jgi:hypothetical protein
VFMDVNPSTFYKRVQSMYMLEKHTFNLASMLEEV